MFQLLICTGIINYNLYESNLILGYFRRDVHRLWQRPVSVNTAARGERFTVESDSVFVWEDVMWRSRAQRDTVYIYSQMGPALADGHSSEKCTCQSADTQTICRFVNGANTATYQGRRGTSDTELSVTSCRKCGEKAWDWSFSSTLVQVGGDGGRLSALLSLDAF